LKTLDVVLVDAEFARQVLHVVQGGEEDVHRGAAVHGFGGRQVPEVGNRVVGLGIDAELLGVHHFYRHPVVGGFQNEGDFHGAQVQRLVGPLYRFDDDLAKATRHICYTVGG
jgi:hypothetical protein